MDAIPKNSCQEHIQKIIDPHGMGTDDLPTQLVFIR
jgi:hypothetical protein